MNPQRTIMVGVLVLMMALSMIPVASALSVTRTQWDVVPGFGNAETYSSLVYENTLYVAGVNQYAQELAIYSWGGQGTVAKELDAIDMNGYSYTPTDMIAFDENIYISTMNVSNLGIDHWETNLYMYDVSGGDLSVATTFPNSFLPQMAVVDDRLVVAGDQNVYYSTDDGDTWDTTNLIDQTVNLLGGYVYDTYILGIAAMEDTLYVEARNCTSFYPLQYMKNPNQPSSSPNQPMVGGVIADTLEIFETDDIDDAYVSSSPNETHLTLSRTLTFRSAVFANYSNKLYAMPNGADIALVANTGVYAFNADYDFARYYNGDDNFNPTPPMTSPLTGANKDNQVYINTINSANQAPACPASLLYPRGFAEKPVQQEKKVMQGFDASSAITTTRTVFLLDTTTGKLDEIFAHSETSMWDTEDFAKGSLIYVTTQGVFAYHAVTIDLSGAINSLFLALLIIGAIFIAFGVLSWNKGLEDVVALSLGGSLVTTGVLLYLFPTLYLSWMLLLVPIVLFFGLMYASIKSYNLNKLDFRLKQRDALIMLGIVVAIAVIEVATGYFSHTFAPYWLPA